MPTLNDTVRKARKDHVCFLCGEPIPAETQYVRRSGVEGREWWDCAMHRDCAEYAHDTFRPDDWESVMEGDVDREDVAEHMRKKRCRKIGV